MAEIKRIEVKSNMEQKSGLQNTETQEILLCTFLMIIL